MVAVVLSHQGWSSRSPLFRVQSLVRNVDVRLPGKWNSNSHGARPVHLIISLFRSQEAGEEDGEGKGYGPYALAEKRAGSFGTAGRIVGNGGTSKVDRRGLYGGLTKFCTAA